MTNNHVRTLFYCVVRWMNREKQRTLDDLAEHFSADKTAECDLQMARIFDTFKAFHAWLMKEFPDQMRANGFD